MNDSVAKTAQPTKNVEAIYPLSPLQEGLLFHTLSAPSSGIYFVQSDFTLRGTLNTAYFKQAWERVASRHSSLRTLFLWKGRDKPLQIVRRHITLPWNELDWRQLPPDQQKNQLDSLLREERSQGFDLNKAPLFRFSLIRTDDSVCHFIWSFHHLLLDGWSYVLILNEVLALYDAFIRGNDLQLDPVTPYREYIAWLQRQDLYKAEIFWREKLNGITSPTPFGVDMGANRDPEGSHDHHRQRLELSESSYAALKAMARERRLTVNTLIQGAWAIRKRALIHTGGPLARFSTQSLFCLMNLRKPTADLQPRVIICRESRCPWIQDWAIVRTDN